MKTTRLGGMNTLRAHTHTASPPLILTANVKALQPPLDSWCEVYKVTESSVKNSMAQNEPTFWSLGDSHFIHLKISRSPKIGLEDPDS